MKTIKLNVEGMTCGHCTGSVESSLKEVGVSAKASVENKNVEATFDESNMSADKIKSVIEDLGYDVID